MPSYRAKKLNLKALQGAKKMISDFLGTLKRYLTEFSPQLVYPNAKLGEKQQAQVGSNWDQLGSKWTEWDSAGL